MIVASKKPAPKPPRRIIRGKQTARSPWTGRSPDDPPILFHTEGAALFWAEVGKRPSKCRSCQESIPSGDIRIHVHSRLQQGRQGMNGGQYYKTDRFYHTECVVRAFSGKGGHRDPSCKFCRRLFNNWEKPRRKAVHAGMFYEKGVISHICEDCVSKYQFGQCDNCLAYQVKSRLRTVNLTKNLEVSYCDRCVKREGNDAWVMKEFQRIRTLLAEKGI